MKRAGLLALLAPALIGAVNPLLVPDVSQRDIQIVYSFTGVELLLFGAIVYPGGRAPERQADIAVVVKGPVEPIVLREKQKVAGIWVNADSARFRSAPAFYAVASSRPLDQLVDERTSAIYELGIRNLQLSPADADTPDKANRFKNGLVDVRERSGLYAEQPGAVRIADGVLYRARIRIPARVPVGTYTAETFLIQDGRVIAAAVKDIQIRKSGFEQYVARAAEDHGFIYGILAVALSVGLGWAAGALFRRF
ncbi:TIGR02186 family protein [Sphingomonas tabacisoli]|uniref:TIGR02186 family protein n=1 Tax=Sphingomonas tabacisoli TaxID=2249466 RepID=A0ABW4HZP3_9SPHN